MGHIIFLRVETSTHAEARALAVELVDNLRGITGKIDPVSTQVADEASQSARRSVLCGRPVDGAQCVCLDGHSGDCSLEWPA